MRVLVCRARPEAEATARRLVAAGHQPVIAPVLEIMPLPFDGTPAGFDALLMTSPHAAAGLAGTNRLQALPVYTVGPASAEAARRVGFADVRIGPGDGAALRDLLRLTLPAPARLLYIAGRVRKTDLPGNLMADGYAVTIRESYDARPAPPWEDAILRRLRDGEIDACLHFSRRSADLALAASRRGGVEAAFLVLRHVCLSADVACALPDLVPSGCIVAAHPDEAGLLQALGRS